MLVDILSRSPRAAVLALATLLLAGAVREAEAQVTADLQLLPNQIYYISDFDLNGTGTAADLFTFVVTNNSTNPLPNTRLRVFMTSDRSSVPIVDGTIQTTLMPGSQTFTYRNFRGLNTQVINFTFNSNAVGQITDAILRTGRLPSGIYYITAQVLLADTGQSPPSDTEILVITNPITLDLISPGQLAGQVECPVVFSNLPQFTWNSDADRFLLTVCEKLSNNSGPEDVMQNPPRLQKMLTRGQDFFGTPSYLYPSSGLPLQPGHVYYWQITLITNSSSGEVRLPGEIWCFQMQNGLGSDRALLLQELLSLLASLGLQDAADLFAVGGPLEGYLPTGRVRLKGQVVDLSELFALLRGGNAKVKNFTVE